LVQATDCQTAAEKELILARPAPFLARSVLPGVPREKIISRDSVRDSATGLNQEETPVKQSLLIMLCMALSACGPSESFETTSEKSASGEELAVVQSSLSNPIGYHDGINSTTTWGWACDPDNYSQPLQIHFYKENFVLIGSTTANLGREPAVGSACGGNPYHGFSWTIPESLKDGVQHYIYAYAIDLNGVANPLLGSSPKVYGPVGYASTTTLCGNLASCPSGQHPITYGCSSQCNGGYFCGSTAPANTVQCQVNGSNFFQCGTNCPSGWHSTSIGCSDSCKSAAGNSCADPMVAANSAMCAPNHGSFNQCGTTCPAGYRASATYCSESCKAYRTYSCTSTTPANAATCVPG
jgi:hypothetical protein